MFPYTLRCTLYKFCARMNTMITKRRARVSREKRPQNYFKPELISPAGDPEKLKIAFLYGADAVYASTPKYSMRTREIGFTDKTLKEGIKYAHSLGKKVYLTINTFPHPGEIENLKKHINKTIKFNPDAIIVADPGVLTYLKSVTDIPAHLSTQANTTNHLSAEFWRKAGVERIVLARELSLKNIKKIFEYCSSKTRTKNDNSSLPPYAESNNNNLAIQQFNNSSVQLEAFVQGAMCMAYSGRCQISNYMTGRDPNKGACIQACRFKYRIYDIEEEMRKGERFQIYEDSEGSYLLNSKDLCMIEHIPELIDAGISSFKIEGRLKSIYYVGIVTRTWRKAIDSYFENHTKYDKEKTNYKREVEKVSNRGFTTGFYFHKPTQKTNNYESSRAKSTWGFVGIVKKYDKEARMATIEVKNYLPKGAKLEIVTPDQVIKYKLVQMKKDGKIIDVAHANYIIDVLISTEIPLNSFVRMKLA